MAIFVEHILKAFNFDFTNTQLVRHGSAHNPQELIVNNPLIFIKQCRLIIYMTRLITYCRL